MLAILLFVTLKTYGILFFILLSSTLIFTSCTAEGVTLRFDNTELFFFFKSWNLVNVIIDNDNSVITIEYFCSDYCSNHGI